jgi:molybdenum cofactor synthesis domain-containing protein
VRVAVLTVSTSKAAGEGADRSGPRLRAFAEELGAEEVLYDLVGDDQAQIEARLRRFAADGCVLVLTTGGTGLAPDDLTPEATRSVIDREIPGIAEAIRLASLAHTDHWMLSRGVAGVCGDAIIVNFPGSPAAIDQVGPALRHGLRHALQLLGGRAGSHSPANESRERG